MPGTEFNQLRLFVLAKHNVIVTNPIGSAYHSNTTLSFVTLIGGPRKRVLDRQRPFIIDPAKMDSTSASSGERDTSLT